jgi:hypothetical protein
MKTTIEDRFASKLKIVDEAPEPLASAMRASLNPNEVIRLLIFGPASKTLNKFTPATLLALLDGGWIVVSSVPCGRPEVHHCDFKETLMVEITGILLYGRLQIDFMAGGRPQSVSMFFNTLMGGLYQEVLQIMLNAMDGITNVNPISAKELYPMFDALPLKFSNAMIRCLPMGQRLLATVHWAALITKRFKIFEHELVPEAVLALTDRELLLISEEANWHGFRPGRIPKYGNIVTYCPLSRINALRLSEHEPFDTLDVELCGGNGGEKLKIDFPRAEKDEFVAFIKQAKRQRALIGTSGNCWRNAGTEL